MKSSFRRRERHAVRGEIAEVSRKDEGVLIAPRQHDRAGVGEIHSRRPLLDCIEHRRDSIRSQGGDVHPRNQPAQSPHGGRVILQAVLSFGNRRFAGDEARRHALKCAHGPCVVGVTAIDRRFKRSGVDDDGSSRRDGGGLCHGVERDRGAE